MKPCLILSSIVLVSCITLINLIGIIDLHIETIKYQNESNTIQQNNTETMTGSIGTLDVDVILSVVSGYSYAQYEHLVVSFRRWHNASNQQLVLFVDSAGCPNVTRVLCATISDFDDGQDAIVNRRFRIYETFITRNAETLGQIFWTDARDVFFQDNVFAPGRMTAGVHLFSENYQLKHERSHNQPWIRDCRGDDMLQQMLLHTAPIVNGGILAASGPDYALGFLRVLIPMLKTCNDQGAMTIIAYEFSLGRHDLLDVRVHSAFNDSWVTHMPIEPHEPFDGGYYLIQSLQHDGLGRLLCSFDNTPYAVVHQGDRFPEVWARRFQSA